MEVGPGRGALTEHLVGRCGRLLLIERDPVLVRALRERYATNTVVFEADAARLALEPLLKPGGALVIGNLPYEASVAILANLLRHRHLIARMVLMFQREVAMRIQASPGMRQHSALSVVVQVRCRVECIADVGPERFLPPPRVWSRLLRLTPFPLDHAFADAADDPTFEDFAHALHAHPRKTVLNSLVTGLGLARFEVMALLEKAGVDPNLRPSHVPLEQVVSLWRIWRGESESV